MMIVENADKSEADRDFDIALRHGTEGVNPCELLGRVAEYLRRGEPVPSVLAEIIADAFDQTAAAPEDARASALALGLGVNAGHRQAKYRPLLVVGTVHKHLRGGGSDTNAVNTTAAELGLSQTQVWSAWRSYKKKVLARHGFLPWDDTRPTPAIDE